MNDSRMIAKYSGLIFVLLAATFGGSFSAIKFVLEALPPTFAAFLRVLLGFGFLQGMLALRGKDLPLSQLAKPGFIVPGIFAIGLPFLLLFWAEQAVSPSIAGIFNGTLPLWTFLFGIIILQGDEVPTQAKILGLLIGLIGILIIFLPTLAFQKDSSQILGLLGVSFMAISYGLGSVLTRRLFQKNPHLTLEENVSRQLFWSVIFLFIAFLVLEMGKLPPAQVWFNRQTIFGMLYLSLFSTALGFLFYFSLIKHWGAVRTSSIAYLIPVMAIIFDFLFFQQIPKANEIVGSILIFSGIGVLRSNLNLGSLIHRTRAERQKRVA